MLPDASVLPAEIAKLGQLQFLRVPETHLADGLEHLGDALATLLSGPSVDSGQDVAPTAGPGPATTMTAHVSGGGSAYQAARDQTIRLK